jgi:hypothetical protein
MKTMDIEDVKLKNSINGLQRLLITRKGKPIALVLGVEGLDQEQLELGTSTKFWNLMRQRRKQPTISREELERRLSVRDRRKKN